jgi:DNA sulfur modification protein DndD
MILQSLLIENFRQFYSRQELEFAQGGADGRNVTLLHGFNGAGKTTLLNVFVWCLYGRTTPDFGSPDRIVSERAFAESAVGSSVEVRVRLRFKLRGDEYLVERVQEVLKVSEYEQRPKDFVLKLWKMERGELTSVGGDQFQHQQRVNQILPEGLYPFFFFNGERVEWLAKKEASQEVERGIKVFLDVEIYERSLRHLRGDVDRELSNELRDIGGEELKQAIEQEEQLKVLDRDLDEKEVLARSNLARIEDTVASIEARQASIASLVELSRQRDSARQALSQAEDRIVDLNGQLLRTLSDDGFLVFGSKIFEKTSELIAQARNRGELPAKLKPQFVSDLLEDQRCICGRSLDPVTDAEQVEHLCSWRKKVGLAEFEEAISQTGQGLQSMSLRRRRCDEEMDRIQASRSEAFQTRRDAQDRLAAVDEQMGDRDLHGEDAEKLKDQIDSLKRDQIDFLANLKLIAEKRATVAADLAAVAHQIRSLRVQGEKANLIKAQKEAVGRVADVLEEIFQIQKNDVREYLSGMVGKIWDDAAIKPYTAGVLDDFSLHLTKNVNGTSQPVHGASTGEKQVLALSFVGSLVRRAKENAEENAEAARVGLVVGGEYPLVMDSPFGSLEDDYRAKVAHWIPTLAHQVVVLVSKTQWREEVERETRPKVGREYVLELHTQKQGADRSIEIAGSKFPYVVETNDPLEQTVIREVK